MNDFDFEELDKAVNALATKTHDEHGGPTPEAQASSNAAASPAEPVHAPVPTQTPIEPKSAEAKTGETSQPARPSAPEPRRARLTDTRPRSRGSFMDIVPPATHKLGGRAGVSIQPLSKPEDIVPEVSGAVEPSEEPNEEKPQSTRESTELTAEPQEAHHNTPKVADAPAAPKADTGGDVAWPDPLDFDENASPPQKEETPEQNPAEQTSPFLAEAKVSKRPLGAFSNFRATHDEPPVAKEPEPGPEPKPVADELTPDQDGTFEEPKAPLADLKKPATEKADKEEEEPDKEPATPDMHSAAMMSIPKQYHTEAKETDKSPRPIFDTKEYHPPLLEAAVHDHRGGGGMWGKIFIALVVLALLAAGGYFAYIYFLQS